MMEIFGFLGSLLGYILWAAWFLVKDFGLAIIIFTIVIRAVLFPFSVKQQKSMANNARVQKKQAELREKYGNNKEKLNEEMQKLYDREGVSMTGGCMTSLVPMLVMLGIFYAVAYPLTNTLHMDAAKINEALSYIGTIPGLDASAHTVYGQIELLKVFPSIADTPFITNLFTPAEITNIIDFGGSFHTFGLDMLTTPNSNGLFSIYILIPILCFVSSIAAQWVTMKMSGNAMQQQGCMKVMLLLMPLISAGFSYSVPVAVGYYWIFSSLIALIQGIVMGKFYNPVAMIAKSEAQHVALLELQEAKVPRVYAPAHVNKGNKNNGKKKKK